jgi:EmrB/QacA subfamily drug resistance transporter
MHGLPGHSGTQSAERGSQWAAAPADRTSWRLLVVLCAAEFMVILDATVVNVALPAISRSFSFAPGDLQWVITAYMLASGGLVLLGGRAADLAGRRRMFLAGLALFTTASLASGLAPVAGALIAARAAQGVGAALLTPAALSIITTSYAGAQRAAALGIWGALGGAGAAVGVLLGGVLTTWLGWRAVFLVNVPVGLAAGLAGLHLVPRAAAAGRRLSDLDLPGAVLGVGGLATIVYALAGAPSHGWASARTLLLLALGALVLAVFALVERRVSQPLVPPHTWRSRSLVAGITVMFSATAILVATFFLNSLFLQTGLRSSPLRVGLEFLPIALVIGATAAAASHLLPRAGSRLLIVAGLILMGGGALLLTPVSVGSSYLTGFLPGLLVIGAGTGLALPATAVTAMSDVTDERAGLASGLMTAAHETGAALGVAVFSAVAVATAGGITAGFTRGFAVAAAIADGLAVIAVFLVPVVRPDSGARAAVH